MLDPNQYSALSEPNEFYKMFYSKWYYSDWYVILWQALYLLLATLAIAGIIYAIFLMRRLVRASEEIAPQLRLIADKMEKTTAKIDAQPPPEGAESSKKQPSD